VTPGLAVASGEVQRSRSRSVVGGCSSSSLSRCSATVAYRAAVLWEIPKTNDRCSGSGRRRCPGPSTRISTSHVRAVDYNAGETRRIVTDSSVRSGGQHRLIYPVHATGWSLGAVSEVSIRVVRGEVAKTLQGA
jgi:hypothetical protein